MGGGGEYPHLADWMGLPSCLGEVPHPVQMGGTLSSPNGVGYPHPVQTGELPPSNQPDGDRQTPVKTVSSPFLRNSGGINELNRHSKSR